MIYYERVSKLFFFFSKSYFEKGFRTLKLEMITQKSLLPCEFEVLAYEDLSSIRMRKKYTRVNILRCVFILRCANQPESKFKLRSHGFYRQEYFCR